MCYYYEFLFLQVTRDLIFFFFKYKVTWSGENGSVARNSYFELPVSTIRNFYYFYFSFDYTHPHTYHAYRRHSQKLFILRRKNLQLNLKIYFVDFICFIFLTINILIIYLTSNLTLMLNVTVVYLLV